MSNIGERWQKRISNQRSRGPHSHEASRHEVNHNPSSQNAHLNDRPLDDHPGMQGHHHPHGDHEHPNYKSFYTYRAEVRRVLSITLGLNVLVVVLKLVVGSWTGSLSLMADALHSITDSANNVLGLVTNQLASPEPDRDHPYGHQKYEAVGALGIAAFLGIACFEILKGAVERLLLANEPVVMGATSLWFLLAVLGINIFVAFYERRVGRRLGSNILIADAQHTMSDIWITIAV
ncbi:MAG: cation diffusion facilitator family transporter, partial [Cyanobacteria bacterium J06553_1]